MIYKISTHIKLTTLYSRKQDMFLCIMYGDRERNTDVYSIDIVYHATHLTQNGRGTHPDCSNALLTSL